MNTESERLDTDSRTESTSQAPSADFIHAISEFLDTDPADLLVELGYYTRDNAVATGRPPAPSPQE